MREDLNGGEYRKEKEREEEEKREGREGWKRKGSGKVKIK